jgi:hypothetical protein
MLTLSIISSTDSNLLPVRSGLTHGTSSERAQCVILVGHPAQLDLF